MKNLDNNTQMELRGKITEALEKDDNNAIVEAMVAMANGIQNDILKEARSIATVENTDRMIMQQRGQAQLTTEERSYYKDVIEKRGFTGLDKTMPKSIFNRVFEDLVATHPILSKIDFINTEAVTEFIIRTSEAGGAAWGKLSSRIVQELEGTFDKQNADMYKLSAFLPVAKDMLQLGAEWLDRYVRTVLKESIAIALELAVVAGSGKDQPIGMLKDLNGSVNQGVYTDKVAKALPNLKPETLGKEIMAPLTKDGKRAVPMVTILVNPNDYWAKIFAATSMLTADGRYAHGILPINAEIIQSVAVPANKLVAGVAKDYMLLLGSNEKIEYSDEYRFLEDERVYITKMHANGLPKDNKSFLVFDITNLDTTNPFVVESKSAAPKSK